MSPHDPAPLGLAWMALLAVFAVTFTGAMARRAFLNVREGAVVSGKPPWPSPGMDHLRYRTNLEWYERQARRQWLGVLTGIALATLVVALSSGQALWSAPFVVFWAWLIVSGGPLAISIAVRRAGGLPPRDPI